LKAYLKTKKKFEANKAQQIRQKSSQKKVLKMTRFPSKRI